MAQPLSDVPVRRPLSRGAGWKAVALIAVALALLAYYFGPWRRADKVDVVGTMIAGFQKQNSLTVFSAQVATVNTLTQKRAFGLLASRQTAIIPATVEYRLDQSRLTPDRFRWNGETQTMTLTLPGLTIAPPNLDGTRAQYFRDGLPVTGAMRDAMANASMAAARREAVREASSAMLQRLARSAAREAMAQNLLLPLRVAGFERANVVVRFADEPGGSDPSYLDASRPIVDVLDERARTTPATTPSS